MLTIEQVRENAPVMADMIRNYAFRCLWYLKNEKNGHLGIAVFQQFKVEIGNKEGEILSQEELTRIRSDEALDRFTQFINDSGDISVDKVFKDDKAIYNYTHPRILLPDFLEPMVIKLD